MPATARAQVPREQAQLSRPVLELIHSHLFSLL